MLLTRSTIVPCPQKLCDVIQTFTNPSLRSWVAYRPSKTSTHLLDICRFHWKSHQGVDCGSLLAWDILALNLNRNSSESSYLVPWLQARPGLFTTKAFWLGSLPFLSEFLLQLKITEIYELLLRIIYSSWNIPETATSKKVFSFHR